MKFKVLNAHEVNKEIYISGCYVAEPGEEQDLNTIRELLEEVNKDINGNLQCDRYVSNSKTVLFKSVPIDTVFSVLKLQNDAFELHMKIVLGKNMHGNKLTPEVQKYFMIHQF